jgi:hypothetical protein
METPKSALIEKLVFALLPFTFSGLVYLLSALNDVNEKGEILLFKLNSSSSILRCNFWFDFLLLI